MGASMNDDASNGYIASLIPGVNVDPHIKGRSAQHRRRAEIIEQLTPFPATLFKAVERMAIADAYVANLQAPWRDMSRFSFSVSDP